MQQVNEILPKINRKFTSKEVEAARKKAAERQVRELGMCQIDCEHCQGLGWLRTGDGKMEMCPNVDRWRLPSASRIGITRIEADNLSWSEMILEGNIKTAVESVQKVLAWGYGWVYLYGTWGVGKTHILKIAVAEALRQNKEASYVRMAEILDHLRAAFDEESGESDSSRLNWWASLPVLAIDEFDKLRGTPYGDERRFVLMDRRYEDAKRQNSLTLIAANIDPTKLPGYICDRVSDGRFFVVRIDNKSFRPGMTW